MAEQELDPTAAIAEGLKGLFLPLATRYESGVSEIQQAQASLEERINVLHAELEEAVRLATFPDSRIQQSLQKIANLRKRISALAIQLNAIRERTQKMHSQAQQRYRILSSAAAVATKSTDPSE